MNEIMNMEFYDMSGGIPIDMSHFKKTTVIFSIF